MLHICQPAVRVGSLNNNHKLRTKQMECHMLCKLLTILYGRDTRAVLVGSVMVNVVLTIAVLLDGMKYIDFILPKSLENNSSLFIGATITAGLIGWLTPYAVGDRKQVFKSFVYLVSTVVQIILANGFVSDSPPLSLMLLVSTALSIWFLGAAVYVFKCEGLDGDHAKRSRV